jgi:hypothetical protein
MALSRSGVSMPWAARSAQRNETRKMKRDAVKNSQLESADANDTGLRIGRPRAATLNIGPRNDAGRDAHKNTGVVP